MGYPFDGKAKNPYIFPLVAKVLQDAGLSLVVIGDELQPAKHGITTKDICTKSDLSENLHYFDRKDFFKALHQLTDIRMRLGLRTGFNTIEKLPRIAESDYAITGVFHKPYVEKYIKIFADRYRRFALLQGNEGTPELFSKGRLWIGNEEKIDEIVKKEKLLVESKPHTKAKISNFKYEEGITGYHISYEDIVSEEWNLEEKRNLVESEIKQTEEYKDATEIISRDYDIPIKQADDRLLRFTYNLVESSIKEISKYDITNHIMIFISELEHNPILWRSVVWLGGIYLETDLIKINDSVKIKKPEPRDLEYDLPELNYSTHDRPSAIMCLEYRVEGSPKMQSIADKIIVILKLYKIGSIYRIKIKFIPPPILKHSGSIIERSKTTTAFKYGLKKEDEEQLHTFFDTINSKIPDEVIEKGTGEVDFITIAFDRYNDSILKQDVPESRLLSAIMSLEALYLKDTEKSELSERLAQRTALTLSFFNYSPLEVFNIIKRSYDIRSRFVHGSKIEEDDQKDVMILVEKVIEYTRRSLVIYLQINESIDKNKFLNLLSKSLLDKDAKEKLQKMLEGNVKV